MKRKVLVVLAAACGLLPGAALPADAPKLSPGTYHCISGITKQPVSIGAILKDDNTYTDLEGDHPGSYVVDGTGITFADGVMDGYVAEIEADDTFKIGLMATCTLKQG